MSAGIILCVVLCAAFGTAIPWALRADRADHLLHKPGTCHECDQP